MTNTQQAESLVAQLQSGPSIAVDDTCDRDTQILSQLAVLLRDSDTRATLSGSALPTQLSSLLNTASGQLLSPITERYSEKHLEAIEQVGRVAANLAANNDVGRDGLVKADYVDKCCTILSTCCYRIDQALLAVKALIASLLNLIIEGHEKSIEAVRKADNSEALFQVSRSLIACDGDDDPVHQIMQWTWTILETALEGERNSIPYPVTSLADSPDHPDDEHIDELIAVFSTYRNFPRGVPIPVLASAANMLEVWMNREDVDSKPYTSVEHYEDVRVLPPPISVISKIYDFVESASLPGLDIEDEEEQEGEKDDGEDLEEEEGEGEDDEKDFSKVKGSLINAVVGLSSSIPPERQDFWSRMRSWLGKADRNDLQSCALLAFGNLARNDTTAVALLSSDETVLPSILAILQPGITAQVLHGAIGVLRNLSIPSENKVILGKENLLDRFVELGVWAKGKDMLGSVQGGAVATVKNLCRSNGPNAERLAKHSLAIQHILDLLDRTDDPAVRFEATRVFVNCIRSLCSPGCEERSALPAMEQERIIDAIMRMFQESGPYPVLANESVIALALLATFGSADTAYSIRDKVQQHIERLLSILAPTSEESEKASKEVQANTATLLKQLDERGGSGDSIVALVQTALTSSPEDRQISEDGQSL